MASYLDDDPMPRLALASIIAVVGGIALMNVTSTRPGSLLSWWLIYAVGSGIALGGEYREPISRTFALAALPAAIPLLEALVLQILSGQSVRISGAQHLRVDVVVTVFAGNWMGIWLFSYARRAILRLIDVVQSQETVEKLKIAERVIRSGSIALIALASAIAAVGYIWPT